MLLAVPCGSSGKGILAVQPAVTGNNTGSSRTLKLPRVRAGAGPLLRFGDLGWRHLFGDGILDQPFSSSHLWNASAWMLSLFEWEMNKRGNAAP